MSSVWITALVVVASAVAQPLRASSRAAMEEEAALRGLDPVELVKGNEVPGVASLSIVRDGFTYLFANELNRTRFRMEPQRYEIQLGGACASMGPLSGKGHPSRFLVHDGLIYVFASDPCRARFASAPERCLDRDDPELTVTPEDLVRGRELLARVLQGLGGEDRVDAVQSYRVVKQDVQKDGEKEHVLRDTYVYRFPGEFREENTWDKWRWVTLVTPEGGVSGQDTLTPLTKEGTKEFLRQMGREVLFLARQRASDGFTFVAGASDVIGGAEVDRLLVRYRGATTALFIERSTGRVLRASWNGRVGSGWRGDVVVDFSDFRSVGGLTLPHVREVTMDGQRVSVKSGALEAVEVDPELDEGTFRRL